MPFEHKTRQRVAFADTDMAGIVHFAKFFHYMEEAEHEFLRSLGLSVHQKVGEDVIGWPRVKADCEYLSPLRFEDEFEVHLQVREKKEKSLTFDFKIRKVSPEKGLVARGRFSVACVRLDSVTNQLEAIPIPPEMSAKIEVAP